MYTWLFFLIKFLLIITVFRASALSSAVSTLANTGMSFSRMDEKEKQQALEEEQARLQALKVLFFFFFFIYKFVFCDFFYFILFFNWVRVKTRIGLK